MIIVLGAVTAKPDGIDAVRRASVDHVRRSRLERWRDIESLRVQFRQPGSLTLLRELKGNTATIETTALHEASDLPL